MIIESGGHFVLVDPMIGTKGSAAPPFAFIRSRPLRNPIVNLPRGAEKLIKKTSHCLITHQHADHMDKTGIQFLAETKTPVFCSELDAHQLLSKGINVVQTLKYWEELDFLGGTIMGTPCRHGYGYVAKPMGKVMGFLIKLPNEPSVYLSSDTIYTGDVKRVLKEFKPVISVLACGTAQLDVYKPLLMTIDDIVTFIKTAPGKVICNHLEAVNHCHTDRAQLTEVLKNEQLLEKVWIPLDGESKQY